MSYHVIHILTHGSKLHIDRGCLVCAAGDKEEKRLPKDDIIALIIAARGVLFTGECLSSLIKNNCIVVHCDEKYRPIGKTVGLCRTVHRNIFLQQISMKEIFSEKLWHEILKAKILNQAYLLGAFNKEDGFSEILAQEPLNESYAAKKYWASFFSLFRNAPFGRVHRKAGDSINQMLNYGYAVIGALVHRSIVAHGLNSQLGIHHRFRFKSDPLVYDLMEPLRPFCDYFLIQYEKNNKERDFKRWIKMIGLLLTNARITADKNKAVKMIYCIDKYINSIANCFESGKIDSLFIPSLKNIKIEE